MSKGIHGNFEVSLWKVDSFGLRIDLSAWKYDADCSADWNISALFTFWHTILKLELVTDRKNWVPPEIRRDPDRMFNGPEGEDGGP